MTARIREFLKRRTDEGPCLVVDLDVVRDNYNSFAKSLPDSKVYYAIKANPAPEILKLLVDLGACFDVASVAGDSGAPSGIAFWGVGRRAASLGAMTGEGLRSCACDDPWVAPNSRGLRPINSSYSTTPRP